MEAQPAPDAAVEAARALSRSAIFANGFNSVAVSEAVTANAGALDRDQLLKVVRLLTARLAMFSRTLGEFIEQIPNRQVERMTALNQMNGFWEQSDYDW
ncbi:hypothetical protein [Mycobacterium palustre]|uniref:Uncharacterized protein n=1 Tax=Mycobacterium palustre TaxID=153971 RepID=A0A1X1ZVY5_9MYCO|nr:hypothetical protein [Mycobacterium palustre]MCV7101545.1 hypothetical protein [Mycobacterium palustre]ORW28188.1 hypothetical protein AWC19_27520 [Mycobacterium palustre]